LVTLYADLTTKKTGSVHFVVIFDQKSIHVRDSLGSLSRSFLYPDWGAAYFWDPRGNNEPGKYFAGNLLQLLGLDHTTTCSEIKPFDIDRLLLNLLQTNVQRIATARTAYGDLLAKSSFIEIPEDLNKLLHKWALTAENTQRALDEGALCSAVKLSAKTARLAEDAFYHPSLMGKMYFPEEHKYAVYMPLLLPTLLPILIGIFKVASVAIKKRHRV
jgi:phosphatidylinositol glycan class S